MPHRSKKRTKRDDGNTKSANIADLQSPLHFLNLDTPASSSSLTCSPSHLTPLNTTSIPEDKLPHSEMTTDMEPFCMNPHDEMQSSEDPLAGLHSKLHVSTQRYSRTSAINNFHGAFSSSKMLQQVLGLQPPEPYARPPPMPHDLEQQFVAGLQKYGLDLTVPGESPLETLSRAATEQQKTSAGSDFGKKMLKAIREEQESPDKATHNEAGTNRVSPDLKIDLPVWESGYEAVRSASHTFTDDNQSLYNFSHDMAGSTNALPSTAASDVEFEEDEPAYNLYAGFGSTTTLANSLPSRPNSSAAEPRSVWQDPNTTTQVAQIDSFAPIEYGSNHGALYKPPRRSSSLANLRQHISYQAGGHQPKSYDDAHIQAHGVSHPLQRPGCVPLALFPSPRVERDQSWDFVQTNIGDIAPHGFVSGGFSPNISASKFQFPLQFATEPQEALSVPQINVQSPSPTKLPNSKKRSATLQGEPSAKARATDETTGLPVLTASQGMLWKIPFPGNTDALLTLMLPWSLSMQRLFDQLRNLNLFSINSAFPYPIMPPIHQKLVSAAFYDISVTPHKEIRFIGPSDVAEISYNEVDIFAYPEINAVQTEQDRKKNTMKRAFGLSFPQGAGEYRYMSMHQRAATGEGRWAYILLQGNRTSDPTVTPPHALIAWPISATTDTSDCLHTVYPDVYMASRPTPLLAPKRPKRFSSLQNLAARFQDPLRLHHSLRAASSEELPKVIETEGALTLKRTVMKMEKAGRIPLIEGFRVDVKMWEGWMKAVGMGKGKVILWRERE
jgi:hypothetical protein